MAPSKKNHYRTVKYVSAKKPLTFQGDIAKNRAFETVIQESLTDEKKKTKILMLYDQAAYRRDLDNALFYFSAVNHSSTFEMFLSTYAPTLKGKITLDILTHLKLKQIRL